MLERYLVRPRTVHRIRSSWIGPLVEHYLTSAEEHGYPVRHLAQRVPIVLQLGKFAQTHGAQSYAELPAYLEPFSAAWINRPDRAPKALHPRRAREAQGALEGVLRISLPGFVAISQRLSREPFADRAPGFLTYLREERGLQNETLRLYGNHLRQFDAYLKHIGLQDIHALSPTVVSGFLTDRSVGLKPSTIHVRCAVLRIFLRYLHRQQFTSCDLKCDR